MRRRHASVPEPSREVGAGPGQSLPGLFAGDGRHADHATNPDGRGAEPSEWVYTFAVSEDEADALMRGTVPASVQNLVISLVVSAHETPAQAVESMARRRNRRVA